MTMKELAQVAGVSVSMVSRAFSGSSQISQKQREYIFDIAKKSGCYYKYIKKNMYKPVIGIIGHEARGFTNDVILNLQKEISTHGATALISFDNFSSKTRNELISYYVEHVGVDGIILHNPLDESATYNIPIVVLGESECFSAVNVTWKQAMIDAIKHLAEYGHTKIAFIGEPYTFAKNKNFEDIMKEINIPINNDYIICSTKRFEEAGFEAMNTLLALDDPPTAVLAAYDNIAFGVIKSITDHGLSIPEDISVIGMNNNKEGSFLSVPLTTGTIYVEDLCQIAVDLLFELIQTKNYKQIKNIKLSSELVKRGSVAKIKSEKSDI